MFSIGFFELLLVGVVGLLVLGPDRLPGAAREATLWVNRFRRYASEVRRDIEDQVHELDSEAILADMRDGRRLFDDMQRDLHQATGADSRGSAADAKQAPREEGVRP